MVIKTIYLILIGGGPVANIFFPIYYNLGCYVNILVLTIELFL